MGDFVVDGVNIKPELDKLFAEEMKEKSAFGADAQKDIANHYENNRPKFMDGFGEIYLSVSQELYHSARLVFGDQIWEDVEFQDWVWKNYPEHRVKNESRGLHVPVSGFKPQDKYAIN